MQRPSRDRWSPFVVFGRTSLFVYWVHVGIAYGAFSAPLHHALTLRWSLAAFTLLMVLMLGLAVIWEGRRPQAAFLPETRKTKPEVFRGP